MRCIYADQWNHVRRELFELQSIRIVMENRILGQRTARSTSKMPVSITRRSTGCSASTICITGMTISSVALQNRVSVKNKSNHQLTSGNVQNFFRNEISKKRIFLLIVCFNFQCNWNSARDPCWLSSLYPDRRNQRPRSKTTFTAFPRILQEKS